MPDINENCKATTSTPDMLSVEGSCSSSISVNFIGEFTDTDSCQDLVMVPPSSSSRVLLESCEYTTIQDICDVVQQCIDSSGIRGPRGRNGIDAKSGLSGISGISGLNGQNGCNGRDGQDGADGIDGINAVDGGDGASGSDGQDGNDAGIPIRPNDRVPIAGWRGSQQGNTVISDGLNLISSMDGLTCYEFVNPRPDTNYEVVLTISVEAFSNSETEIFAAISSKTESGFCVSGLPQEITPTTNFNIIVFVPREN